MRAPSRPRVLSIAAILLIALVTAGSKATPAETDGAHATALAQLQAQLADGEYSAAIEASRAHLAALEADGRAESIEAADTLDVLVESLWRTGNATEAETRDLGLRALAIKQQRPEENQAGIGKTQHHLAILSFFHGEYPEAQALWESAIAHRQAALGSDHPDVAESMNGLANLLQMIGDFEEARRLYAHAVEIRQAVFGEQDPRVGHTLNNLASLYNVTADYAAALPVAERSLEIKRKAFEADNPEIAVGLLNLADLLDRTGDRRRARKLAEEAVEILRKAHGEEHPEVAAGLNNLAEQHRRAGEYAEALPLFEKALAIWEKSQGAEHANVALALNNLAALHEEIGDLQTAKTLQQRGVAIREKALGAEHPDVAESLNNLAKLLSKLREDEDAAAAFRRSLEIRRAAYGGEHPSVAESLGGLARVVARSGAPKEAAAMAIESERIAREHLRLTGRTFAEEHALRYASTRNRGLDLALTLAVSGRSAAAEVMDAVIRSRAVVLDEMAERHRASQTSADPQIARLAEELAKARARLANLTVRGPGNFGVEMYRGFMADALEAKEKAERALGAASSAFARQQRSSRQGLAEVAASLPEGSALVSFVQYRHLPDAAAATDEPPEQAQPSAERREPESELSYAALVLRSGSTEPMAIRIGEASKLDPLISQWKSEAATGASNFRRSDEASEAIYRDAGVALRERLWSPAAIAIEGAERVFIVPDGAINLVSFVSLPLDDVHYLIERGPTVHYLSAERDVTESAGAETGSGLLALGGPNYDGPNHDGANREGANQDSTTTRSGGCSTLQSLRFSPLPAAVAESEEVVGIWRRAQAGIEPPAAGLRLSGDDASEAAFKQNAIGKRILHVATHGFFLGGDCNGATGAAGGTRGFTVVEKEEPVAPVLDAPVSPLLLSGLAMAGANLRGDSGADGADGADGGEDGVLTAEEIAGMELNGVEWAVLSACDTGVGEIQAGEGVFGLRRAMQVAGVRTLILSLWPVDDEATRSFMGSLYRGRLEQKLDSAESVRQAGREVLETRRKSGKSTHPFFWAAFVAAGDWR